MQLSASFGLAPGELRLETVGSGWAHRFAEERSCLAAVLKHAALDIQHIGSTAVPGIMAKPILDIGIAIRNFESWFDCVSLVVALGYTYRGENGIARRHFLMREGTHHLHVFEQYSVDWRRHIFFRDRLIANPVLALRYGEIKLAAVKQAKNNRERYQEIKGAFIESVQTL